VLSRFVFGVKTHEFWFFKLDVGWNRVAQMEWFD